MWFEHLKLKNFLCRYSLKMGAYVVGIVFSIIIVLVLIATLVQMIKMKDAQDMIYKYPWRNAYGYSITAVLYSFVMLVVNLWFLWGVHVGKRSIILSWVVMSAMWILLCFCLIISMVVIISVEMDQLYWILSLVFGLIAIGILIYGTMVGYSFWCELKTSRTATIDPSS